MLSDYELERERNIARNKELLASLGLDKPFFEPKETRQAPKVTAKKRKPVDNEDDGSPPKNVRKISGEESASGVRRSQRNAGKTVDYTAEMNPASRMPMRVRILPDENTGPLGREGGKRTHDPKTYGAIPGIAVGTWWESRQGCSADAVHAPWVAGIAPGPKGAYSVALSGGYDDDVDLGYAFTYTGSGGRDLKGTIAHPKNLRTAPQSSDQTFENNFNRALQKSSETRKPIRVIRGFKLRSRYGPSEGYRYDGLYIVEKAWIEKGLNLEGYLVCKFAFKRISGQPPLQVRNSDETELDGDNENDDIEEEPQPEDD